MNEPSLSDMTKILDNYERRITALEELLSKRTDQVEKPAGNNLETLSKKSGVSVEKLNELFDFESEKLTLLRIDGKDIKEKTLKLSLIVLFAYKQYFDKDELKTQELRRNASENGLSLGHFGDYLNELIPMHIRRIGKPNTANIIYRITSPGETKAKEILQSM